MPVFRLRESALRDGDTLREAEAVEPLEPSGETFPLLIVEASFTAGPTTGNYLHLDDTARGILDTNTLAGGVGGGEQPFTDITAPTRSVNTKRGSSQLEGPIVRYEAGTLSALLRNADRRFDPTNLSGPYVAAGATQVEPMRLIRVRATWDGTTYHIWRGYADNWDVGYSKRRNYSEVSLTATDGFKVLSNDQRQAVAAVGAGEDSGARIERILDSTDWEQPDRVIATGDSTLQATTLEGDPLSELLLVADTEIGELYIDGQGRVVFRNRNAVLEETRSAVSQATFGDGGGNELPYYDVSVEYGERQLINEAHIARVDGVVQTASDATSKTKYLTSSYERTDLLMETDGQAASYAGFIVAQSKDPELRFSQLVIKPKRDPDRLFPQVLGREIGDRITVILRPEQGDPISRDCFIRGIEHDIDASTRVWVTTWHLQSATRYSFFVLDHATLGVLDANALSY